MPTKMTMFVNVPNGGFSETWYNNTDFPSDGQLAFQYQGLANARAALLAKQAQMIGFRVTDTTNPRKSILQLFPGSSTSAELTDVPTTAWLAICKGNGGLGRRQLWLRGVGDDMVTWDPAAGRFQYDGNFGRAWANYRNVLLGTAKGGASGWCVKHVLGKSEQPGAVFAIGTINSPPGATGVVLTAPGVPNYTTPIIVAGFKKPLNVLNGTYLPNSGFIMVGGAPTLLHKSVTAFQAASYPGGATVRVQSTSLVQVTDISLEWARERRVGRAFFELHGRRSGR